METVTIEMCEDCEQDFPREELTNAWAGNPFGLVRLWCNECRDSYDPTPQEQWEVTTPPEVNWRDLD